MLWGAAQLKPLSYSESGEDPNRVDEFRVACGCRYRLSLAYHVGLESRVSREVSVSSLVSVTRSGVLFPCARWYVSVFRDDARKVLSRGLADV